MKGITLMCGDSSPVNPHLSLFIPEYFASEMQKKKKKYCLLELKIIMISEHLFKISPSWQIPNMGTKYNINFFRCCCLVINKNWSYIRPAYRCKKYLGQIIGNYTNDSHTTKFSRMFCPNGFSIFRQLKLSTNPVIAEALHVSLHAKPGALSGEKSVFFM